MNTFPAAHAAATIVPLPLAVRKALYDFSINRQVFIVTVQTAGKLVREAASSLLVSGFSYQFSYRMDIRCFLTGLFGQEDEPSELLLFINILLIFLTVAPSIFTFEDSADSILCIKGRNDLCCC